MLGHNHINLCQDLQDLKSIVANKSVADNIAISATTDFSKVHLILTYNYKLHSLVNDITLIM